MIRPLLVAAFVLCGADALRAGGTSYWTHQSESDFEAGTFERVVVSSAGDLTLSRGTTPVLAPDARLDSVLAMVEAPDGTVFAGGGPGGQVFRVRDARGEVAVDLGPGVMIFSLALDGDGALLIGTGGERGRVLRLEADGSTRELLAPEGVQYVWSILPGADGSLFVATGPDGQVWQRRPDGEPRLLLDTTESNVLCLERVGEALYAGTDPGGLVYRIDATSGAARVVWDAAESEITAIAADPAGNVYAATGQTDAAPPAGVVGDGRGRSGLRESPIADQPPRLPDENAAPRAEEPPADDAPADGVPTHASEPAAPATAPAAPEPAQAATPALGGNAVYRIDTEGFVTEVFRREAVLYSLVWQEGRLIAGGDDGRLFQIDPGPAEAQLVARGESEQVTSLRLARDGRLLAGLANPGRIIALSRGLADEGTYTSPALDAGQISRLGSIYLRGDLPAGASLGIAARSGNLADPASPAWGAWSAEQPATRFVSPQVEPARFMQYRLRLRSADGTRTPTVDEIRVAYRAPNLPPQVRSVTVTTPAESEPPAAAARDFPAAPTRRTISWDAVDPNGDALLYTVEIRSDARGPWMTLKDDLAEPTLEWNTRVLPDGRYEVRVTASDARGNEPGAGRAGSRISQPVLIDHTPPALRDLVVRPEAGRVEIALTAVDRTGSIARLDYALDALDRWQAVAPLDTIADSPEEAFRWSIDALAPGVRQVTLRAVDAAGNAAFETLIVEIPNRP